MECEMDVETVAFGEASIVTEGWAKSIGGMTPWSVIV